MIDSGEQSILENQSILPAQFFPSRPNAARMEPLKRLALAVLMDAVHVFQNNFGARSTSGKRQFHEAREWLLGAPGHGPFAFENVCYLSGIDPSRLRKSLYGWLTLKRAGQPCRSLSRRSPVLRRGALHLRRPRRRTSLSV